MISKNDASQDGKFELHWGYSFKGKDFVDLPNHTSTADDIADFNGKTNTEIIKKAYADYNVAMESDDMCYALEQFNKNDYSDWYIPATGQLYEMYQNLDKINASLIAMGGSQFETTKYWSSSESTSGRAKSFNLYDKDFTGDTKTNNYRVRFVRDL